MIFKNSKTSLTSSLLTPTTVKYFKNINNGPIETKLGIENIQVGFPLILTRSCKHKHSQQNNKDKEHECDDNDSYNKGDYLCEKLNGQGLLSYLNEMIKCPKIKMPNALQQAKILQGIDLNNFPYKVINIGNRKNIKEELSPTGRMVETRQIKISEKIASENPMEKFCLTEPEDICVSIIHSPVVPDLKWKQFCITLSQFCPQYKEIVIDALTWPQSYFDNTEHNLKRLKKLHQAFEQIETTTNQLPTSTMTHLPLFLNTVTNITTNAIDDHYDSYSINGDNDEDNDNTTAETCHRNCNTSITNNRKKISRKSQCTIIDTTLQQFENLRESINSLDNPAYVETFIYGLTSLLAHNDCTHLFSKLYTFGRGREINCLLTDPQINTTWKQFTAISYSDSYYQKILCMHSSIDLEMLMEDLFQIVFGLDYAQHAFGFIHGNLDIRYAVGCMEFEKGVLRLFKWHGRYFQLPGNGRVVKLHSFKNASVMINNVVHSADFNDFHRQHSINNDNTNNTIPSCHRQDNLDPDDQKNQKNKNKNTFNTDMVRLAATLCRVLSERQGQYHCKDPKVIKTFWELMNRLVNCGNSDNITNIKNQGHGHGVDIISSSPPGGASIDKLHEFKLKCLQEDNSTNETCTWNNLVNIPNHETCTDALPCDLIDFFKMFEIDESLVSKDPNHLIYTLD